MQFRGAAVLLLLVLQLGHANRINDKRNQNSDIRHRRHDSEERTSSGRRWTTSRNSPYQKIVSSFEQGVPDLREASSEIVETSTSEEPDEAKAKSSKRKPWRTSASSHDQIPSESSSDNEGPKVTPNSNAPEAMDSQVSEGHRNQKPAGSTSRRRSTTSHPREASSEVYPELSTSNPKKRRRPATTTATTTTLAPQTMSDSLYQYFRPLEQDVPQDDIIPFLDFGRKLSPVVPTPSGANSIENKSVITKLRPRNHHAEKESNSSDEEILQEDMDVTVVKKAIERNSVPRAKLRVREQGISDYYRKRVPAQVRTTENLVSTSDSSTASSVIGPKNVGVLKKINRHQIHHVQPLKLQEQLPLRLSAELENLHAPKNVELLQEKRRQLLSRPVQRVAAIKQEVPQAPLTAESSLVRTVIKELPIQISTEREPKNTTMPSANITVTKEETLRSSNSSPHDDESSTKILPVSSVQDKRKILSTAVVTSVSVQETLQDARDNVTGSPDRNTSVSSSTVMDHTPSSTVMNKSTGHPVRGFMASTLPPSSSHAPANESAAAATAKAPSASAKTETPLRSRDIYRPKALPPGTSIPHLPRQIPFINPHSNPPQKGVNATEKPSSNTTLESSDKSNLTTQTTTSSTTTTTAATTTTTTTTAPTTVSSSAPPPETPTTLPVVSFQTTPAPKMIVTESPKTTAPTTEAQQPAVSGEGLTQGNVDTIKPPTEEIARAKGTQVYAAAGEVDEQSSTEHLQPTAQTDAGGAEHGGQPPQTAEGESVPLDTGQDGAEEQFPVYLTTVTVPVVDTRPDTEAAVVEEQKNLTTPRPGADWVKVGAVNKDVEVVYSEPLGLGAYLLAGLGVVPVILGALIGARFIMAHNRKKVLDESEYSSEYNRSPLGVSTPTPLPTKLPRIPTHVSWGETEKNGPVISPVTSSATGRWEFPREKLRLQTVLGQGNFGQVWKAEADDIAGHEGLTRLVAVKTVKESASAREREDLLRELGIMQELGSHPNVVTLLGCCTEKEPIYLIMEYVMYGKLLSFLRDHRTRAHYYNFSDATDALTSRDLTVFGYCVARGMDYLTNKSIIHRDLAARNVLVDHNKLCKIADFGMSRNVRDTGQIYEQRQSKGALPIRWMAPESLHFSLFTHKTDVWSFGILMWEIVTLGSTPYATMGAREVMRRVRDGYRLDRPSHCRPELFRVICKCWHSEPSKRPTFADLKVELGQLLSDSELNGSYVDLDSFADEMRRDTLHRHH